MKKQLESMLAKSEQKHEKLSREFGRLSWQEKFTSLKQQTDMSRHLEALNSLCCDLRSALHNLSGLSDAA
jgi:hypothetical protein